MLMNRYKITCALFFFFLYAIIINATEHKDVFGYWKSFNIKTKKPDAIVKIYKKDNLLYGKVVKLLPEKVEELKNMHEYPPVCKKCPGEFKNKPIIGIKFIYGLKKDGNVWKGGKILDPEKGNIYKVKIWVSNNNNDILLVRGYLGPFYKTQKWQRVDNSTHY